MARPRTNGIPRSLPDPHRPPGPLSIVTLPSFSDPPRAASRALVQRALLLLLLLFLLLLRHRSYSFAPCAHPSLLIQLSPSVIGPSSSHERTRDPPRVIPDCRSSFVLSSLCARVRLFAYLCLPLSWVILIHIRIYIHYTLARVFIFAINFILYFIIKVSSSCACTFCLALEGACSRERIINDAFSFSLSFSLTLFPSLGVSIPHAPFSFSSSFPFSLLSSFLLAYIHISCLLSLSSHLCWFRWLSLFFFPYETPLAYTGRDREKRWRGDGQR